jgi:DDE superfamily endonuclease
MNVSSFAKIVTWISKDLDVDNDMALLRGGLISPKICLYLTIRFLSGASYLDVRFFTGISTSSFYRCLWRTILAIRKCPFLAIIFPSTAEEVKIAAEGFTSISSNSAIYTCVAVVDGYHLQIVTPPKGEAKNVRSFFSGHYQTSGFNIQAACDHHCRFVFLGVAGPGNLGDREAVNAVPLGNLVESLPGLFCVIGDCAYTPTEHFVPIFRGENAQLPINDNFNFYASQLRIRIEMAFGLMVKKWGILHRPLSIKLRNVSKLIVVIGQLHNFCINERLLKNNQANKNFRPVDVNFNNVLTELRASAAEIESTAMIDNQQMKWSYNRDRMAKEIHAMKWTRPTRSILSKKSH